MADIAASAIGIISFGIQACKSLLDYFESWKNYNADITRMRNSITRLSDILLSLREFFERGEVDDQRSKNVEGCVQDCKVILEKLEKKLQKLRSNDDPSGLRKKSLAGWQRGSYPLRESTLVKIRELADESQERLKLAIGILHLDISSKSHTSISQIGTQVQRIDTWRQSKQLEEVAEWLSPLEPWKDHELTRQLRQQGTGNSLISSDEYQAWRQSRQGTLLCTGSPGVGKTTLSSLVIDDLYGEYNTDSTVGLAYIYCNYSLQSEQSLQPLFGCLLRQLCERTPSIPSNVVALSDTHKAKRTKPRADELLEAICAVVATCSRVFLVIDALDECLATQGRRNKLIDGIQQAQDRSKISLFLTTRNLPDITERFGIVPTLAIRATDDDLRKYLRGLRENLPRVVKHDEELQNSVEEAIVTSANGIFLLAQLYFESLVGKKTVKAVRKWLSTLGADSGSYNKAYEKLMKRIEDQSTDEQELAKKALTWVTYAKRRLTWLELRHALAVEVGESEFDHENLTPIEDIVTACAGLLVIDDTQTFVRLHHHTAQEYLERTLEHWFPESKTTITDACTTYLSYKGLNDELNQIRGGLPETVSNYPLYDYAVHNWANHASRSLDRNDQVACFLASGSRLPSLSLLLAVKCKEVVVAKWLIESGVDVNLRDSEQKTPLHHAVTHDLPSCVQLLLCHGATLTTDYNNMTPFHYVALTDSTEIGKIFLNKAGTPGDLPLHRQIWLSEADGDQQVWKSRDDPHVPRTESKDVRGLTPLHYAALTGSAVMTRFFLGNGANPNSVSDYGETPLHLAIKQSLHGLEGHRVHEDHWSDSIYRAEGVLENVDLDDEESAKEQAAVDDVRMNVLKMLCDHKSIDFCVQDVYGKSPLHCIRRGETTSEAALSKILGTGVEPDLRDSKGQTALHLACLNRDGCAASILLEHKANVSAVDNEGMNALHYAARCRDVELMRLILDHAKQISGFHEIRDNRSRNALHVLLNERVRVTREAVDCLISSGVNVNELDHEGNSALAKYLEHSITCFSQKAKIAELLFKAGADKSFRTAGEGLHLGHLSASADELGVDLLNVLAKYGVDLKSHDNNGRSMLHYCAKAGSLATEEAVRYLCDGLRLSLHARDNGGKTPMDLVAEQQQVSHHPLLFRGYRWARTEQLLLQHDQRQSASNADTTRA